MMGIANYVPFTERPGRSAPRASGNAVTQPLIPLLDIVSSLRRRPGASRKSVSTPWATPSSGVGLRSGGGISGTVQGCRPGSLPSRERIGRHQARVGERNGVAKEDRAGNVEIPGPTDDLGPVEGPELADLQVEACPEGDLIIIGYR